jgi:hypothetical protein
MLTRRGLDWTTRFDPIAQTPNRIAGKRCPSGRRDCRYAPGRCIELRRSPGGAFRGAGGAFVLLRVRSPAPRRPRPHPAAPSRDESRRCRSSSRGFPRARCTTPNTSSANVLPILTPIPTLSAGRLTRTAVIQLSKCLRIKVRPSARKSETDEGEPCNAVGPLPNTIRRDGRGMVLG